MLTEWEQTVQECYSTHLCQRAEYQLVRKAIIQFEVL